jgi:Ca2+-binding RTX toxin-like protein
LGLYEVNVNGERQYLTKEQLKKVEIRAGGGDDTVVIDPDVKVGVTVDGGDGNDVIIGGGGDDKLSGGRGKDRISSRVEAETTSLTGARETMSSSVEGVRIRSLVVTETIRLAVVVVVMYSLEALATTLSMAVGEST